jgi:Rod binding domain-containing protein
MRKGVKEIQLGDAAGSEIYKDMMDQAIADSMGHQGALGIGKMLYKQFEKQVAGISEAEASPAGTTRSETPSPTTSRGAREPGGIEDAVRTPHLTGGEGASALRGPIPTISTSTKR